jgi:hypothetical protein
METSLVVLVVPALVLLGVLAVGRAGPDELLLVVRSGRVVRTRTGGLALRLPGLERFERIPTGRGLLPLVARARTRDGVDVVLLADLALQVRSVPLGSAPADPCVGAARAAEDLLSGAAARADVSALVDDLPALAEGRLAELRRTLPAGTEALALEVTEVEARLTPGAGP